MAPNDGLSLFCELQKARQCLVLETDLHLIYLVTPYSVSSQWSNIDWLHLLTLWESLTKAMKRVGELVGVQESFIIRNLRGGNKIKSDQNKLNIHKRFYTALALQDLVNEVPLSEVAVKFQCARGFLQSLQQAAATFAGMVTAFCRQLGWKNMEMLISQFQDRLHFGIHSELLELMGLPSLNGKRARTLFDAGYETISSIALADINVIENVLLKSVPFESEKEREGDDDSEVKKRNKIKNIWVTGYCGMTAKEAALNLIVEARNYLEKEIGVSNIKWTNEINCTQIPLGVNEINELNEEKSDDKMIPKVYRNCSIIENEESNILPNKSSQSNNVNEVLCGSSKHPIGKNPNNYSLLEHKPPKDKNVLENLNNEILEMKCTPTLENIRNCDSKSQCSGKKDDIIWDSLNLTEAALENITKLRTPNTMFSPNISFGETDDKTEASENQVDSTDKITPSKSTSTKDVSLFSSDGDTSSIFNDSLPIDLIPSKLLDNKNNLPINHQIALDLEVINSESILNAFKSTLVPVDDDEDIKLVYEEDDDENKETNKCLNVSDDIEVIETQDINLTVKENHFKSPFKRPPQNPKNTTQPVSKKKKTDRLQTVRRMKCPLFKIVTNFEKSKKYTIGISTYKLNCFLLKENDIYDNIHVIENLKRASIYLNVKSSVLPSNEIIGRSILNFKPHLEDLNPCAIQGIAVYFEPMTCLYFDLRGLEGDISVFKKRLSSWLRKDITLKLLSLKTLNFHIKRWLGVDIQASCVDISLSEWLIDSDEKIPNIAYLMKKYCKIDLSTISVKIDNRQKKFRNLDVFEDMCIKGWSVGMIADQQEQYLRNHLQQMIDIEIQVSKILANCEHHGITVDKDLTSRLLIDVRNSQEILQKKAFKLCGYHFNFNSSKDVAKVLGINNGIRKVSTKKSVLTSHHSPMASIVIYWRKLNSILTKTLYPLTEKACIYTEGDRINPSYTMHTCTGRISMHEPNLQNVPRTFSIPLHYLSLNQVTSEDLMEFNCRNIFKAAPGHVMVSADYCQLEMRVLTHFSEDPVLMRIMKSDVDVFKSIASSWSNLPEEEVDDDLRQKAKQLCYGILYGMGNKTLAQYLDVSEMEAAAFMDSFYNTYPAVRRFTQSVIDDCRSKGYVETLTKRRRYLPHINSNVLYKKGAAERQAVNTTIQGSAADIAKAAMCAIDTKTSGSAPQPRLILQMHDELIYEVLESNKNSFIAVLKQVMEETVKLRVPLPVKVKTGPTWGDLEEVRII
ncbi:DNA polymerase theta-like isoform X1 [Manduca sexta]|nr:DNA polymerase theta-like isoform X1 [Manduca sexta]